MNEPGRGLAYAALFSEIGITLLVTTLAGALGGNLLDEQLGTTAVFAIAGFLVGGRDRVLGDLQARESLPRDDRMTNGRSRHRPAPGQDRARRDAALLCVERA